MTNLLLARMAAVAMIANTNHGKRIELLGKPIRQRKSKYSPHQSKKECERRIKQPDKAYSEYVAAKIAGELD